MPEDVGAIFARLGLSISDFESGMKKATFIATSETANMSAAIKRQTREGAESLRLVGESIDLHVSRPLAKVIAQIPGLGTALASLGGATVGAAGLFALGSFLVEKLEPAYEKLKGAVTGWDETAQKAYKDQITLDQQFVQELERHKQVLLEISHIGLSGPDLIRQLISENASALADQRKQMLDLESQKRDAEATVSALPNTPIPGTVVPRSNTGELEEARKSIAALQKSMDELSLSMKKTEDEGKELHQKLVAIVGVEENAALDAYTGRMKKAQEATGNARLSAVNLQKALADLQATAEAGSFVEKQVAALAGPALPKMLSAGTPIPSQGAESFNSDQAAQMKLAAEATEAAGQSVAALQEKLSNLAALQQGPYKVSADAYAAEFDKISRAIEEAQRKADKSLTSMSSGAAAFFSQFQIEAGQQGKFVFDELGKGLEGIEQGIAQLAVTGRTNWSRLLTSMSEDLVKFMEQQGLRELLSMLNGSDFFSGLGGGMFFGSGGLFGGGRADGGDVMPGMTYRVGENGPEYLTMGRNMGQITPNGGGGGDTHNHYYDMRGASVEAVERLQRMLPEVESRAAFRGYQMSLEANKRTTK
jgi:hypothetical protein